MSQSHPGLSRRNASFHSASCYKQMVAGWHGSTGIPYDIRKVEPYSIYDRLKFDVEKAKALIDELVAEHAAARVLLTRNAIRVASRGTIQAEFTAAMGVLLHSNLIDRIQVEYARSLPPGQKPEFVLHPSGSNTWSYVNRHGQRSDSERDEKAADVDPIMVQNYHAGDQKQKNIDNLFHHRCDCPGCDRFARPARERSAPAAFGRVRCAW